MDKRYRTKEAVLMSYLKLCFEQKQEIYHNFASAKLPILTVIKNLSSGKAFRSTVYRLFVLGFNGQVYKAVISNRPVI